MLPDTVAGKAKRRHGADPWPRRWAGPVSWWQDHLRIAAETMRFVSASLGTSFLVWLLVGIALALPSGLLLLQLNLAEMTSAWDGRPGLSVYFEVGAEESSVRAVGQQLEAHPHIERVEITTAAEALANFQAHSGLADALELLDENPLPASLRAVLKAGASMPDLDAVGASVVDAEAVADLVIEKTWMQRVLDASQVVNRLGIILGLLFGVGAVLVTATSVRLAIESRLDELRVLKLVGATAGQMRRPFLYFGAFYGFGGGLVAAMLISLCLVLIENPLANLLGSYGRDLETAGFDPIFLVGLLCVGGLLGVIGALLAAKQRLVRLEVL